jgi:uncharacterized protein YkwD
MKQTQQKTKQNNSMKKLLGALIFSLVLGTTLGGTLLWQPAEAQGATAYTGYITGIEKQATAYSMLGKVNAARQSVSAGTLKWDTTLENAAIARARETAIYFSHTRPTGAAWYTVCSKLNAENLYVGYMASASTANSGWMNSSGHRANRLNSTYKSYAAAAFQAKDGVVYWVELFSKTASASTVYRGVDVAKTGMGVKLTDTYLDVEGHVTDLKRSVLNNNSMRVGGSYYLTLQNENKEFSYSYTQFSKGFFASSNVGIATIDRVTGKIIPVKAGVVKFWARTSTASDKILGFWQVIRPQRVTGLSVTAKVKSASMKWNAIAGANGYEIWRAVSQTGSYTKVGSVSASTTTFTQSGLAAGSNYYYKVRAYVVKSGSTTRYPGYCSIPVYVKVL